MHSPLQNQLLDETSSIISSARPLVEAIERRDRDLGTQIRRALNSVVLNIAEGFGCRAGNARIRFETAHGSLFEARAALSAAVAWRYVSERDIPERDIPERDIPERDIPELCQRMHTLGGRLYG